MVMSLPREEILRVLDDMSFFQKRALKKAGFKWDGLHRLAGNDYGAGLVEAVLACHTDLLGRGPHADEPDKAQAARRHPGVGVATSSGHTSLDVSASGRGQLDIDPELLAQMKAAKKEQKKAKKEQRGRPSGRRLP